MTKAITITDKSYLDWVREIGTRYRNLQIKAAVKVNQMVLRFYWDLGHDIAVRDAENTYGSGFYAALSRDLKRELPGVDGLSPSTIRYAKRFYCLYYQAITNLQQVVENSPQPVEESAKQNLQQVVEELKESLFSIPWGHHTVLIDKFSDNPTEALFYVRQTVENGWSRGVLMTFIDTDLYNRAGKALTNFTRTLPAPTSDLAREMVRDPYIFAVNGIAEKYNETQLKKALLANISRFLLELGTGFAYVGQEYRLQIGQKEKFIDLLFYNLNLSCYVVIEVKIGEFDFADLGQLGGYVVSCNHLLRKEGRDNPTIGLLVCKQKDNLIAQYALESSSQPLGISSFELQKLYPKSVEGIIPTTEEVETQLELLSENETKS